MDLIDQLSHARVFDLEQPRYFGMPTHPAHRPAYFYALYRRHRDTYQPGSTGQRTSASGVLTMMEHSGTHIDALSHQACGLELHGGVRVDDVERADGFREHGAETIPTLLRRGVLLDVAGWKGVPRLEPHSAITDEELRACAHDAGVEVRAGDVLLVRTGYGGCWDDATVYNECAGVSKSGTLWVGQQGVAAVGADNYAWDALKEQDPVTKMYLFAHLHLLVQKGVYILENLNLEALAAAKCYEFAFVAIPLKLRGATGSPIRPLALLGGQGLGVGG